jgi:hypothetical protein
MGEGVGCPGRGRGEGRDGYGRGERGRRLRGRMETERGGCGLER